MKRKFVAILACVAMLGSVFGLTGCKKAVANDDQTLEIFIGNFGYGYEWLNHEIELFKAEDWVKEKYPNLSIPTPKHNSETNYVADMIRSGAVANTIDLFFTAQPACSSFGTTDSDGKSYFEELTDVYESEVPGESGVLLKDKMRSDVYEIQKVEKRDGTTTFYGVPWVDGYMGILYNKTVVDANFGTDYVMPRTTDELSSLAGEIKTKNLVPFISASKVGYWNQVAMTWWAQYEGVQGWRNYWNGVVVVGGEQERSNEIFRQTGRLHSLEALNNLILVDKGNNHKDTNTLEFTQAQAKFMLGEGVMMPNGDWFENEMRANAAENPNDYDIRFMKMPVISAIVEKCNTVKDDKALAFVVDCVDEKKNYADTKAAYETAKAGFDEASRGELSQSDYNRISEARSIMYHIEGHEAYIPSYATAKGVAKDFLRFLATDKAINNFISTTGGAGSPYDYNVETKDPTLYASLPEIQKSRIAYADVGYRLPPYSTFPLAYYGGLTSYIRTANVELAFTSQNASDRKTPEKIFNDEIDYYTTDGAANWETILIQAGLKNA